MVSKIARSTGPGALARAERRRASLELRIQGMTLSEISQATGSPLSTVQHDIASAIKDYPREEADLCRAMENERLDFLWRKAYEQVQNPNPEVSLKAVRAALAVIERRSKLLGLEVSPMSNRAVLASIELEQTYQAAIQLIDSI